MSEKPICPRCGSELGVRSVCVHPRLPGVIGCSMDDYEPFYTCICGYRASDFEYKLDWARIMLDKFLEEDGLRKAYVDFEGIEEDVG